MKKVKIEQHGNSLVVGEGWNVETMHGFNDGPADPGPYFDAVRLRELIRLASSDRKSVIPEESSPYQPKAGDKFTVCYGQKDHFRKYLNEVLECTYADKFIIVFMRGSTTNWFNPEAVELRPLTDAAVKALQA